jgi:hypothetical protein
MKKGRRSNSKKMRRPRNRETERVEDGMGPTCPRCGETTKRYRWPDYQARAAAIGSFVYRWWYLCENRRCRTKQIMPPEAIYDPRYASIERAANMAHS